MFENDFIRVGRKVIRPKSIAWFAIRGAQSIIGAALLYLLYCIAVGLFVALI